MKTKLKNIASIQTGVYAKPESKGEIVYLQSRHFDEFGNLTEALHPDIVNYKINSNHILKTGDVLFAAKGAKNFAVVIEDWFPISVASTSFFVIRLQAENILPEYLTWFLNHPDSLSLLKGSAIGTSIACISKAVLEELEIFIPDIRTQQLILKIAQLWDTEKQLKKQIEALREKQIQQLILDAIK